MRREHPAVSKATCPACKQVEVVVIARGWDERTDKGVCDLCFYEFPLEDDDEDDAA